MDWARPSKTSSQSADSCGNCAGSADRTLTVNRPLTAAFSTPWLRIKGDDACFWGCWLKADETLMIYVWWSLSNWCLIIVYKSCWADRRWSNLRLIKCIKVIEDPPEINRTWCVSPWYNYITSRYLFIRSHGALPWVAYLQSRSYLRSCRSHQLIEMIFWLDVLDSLPYKARFSG